MKKVCCCEGCKHPKARHPVGRDGRRGACDYPECACSTFI